MHRLAILLDDLGAFQRCGRLLRRGAAVEVFQRGALPGVCADAPGASSTGAGSVVIGRCLIGLS